MFDRFCLFNSKIYTTSRNDKGLFLIAYEYRSNYKHSFRELFRLKIPLQNISKPKEALLDVADHYIIGMKCIVILIIGYSNIFFSFLYFNMLQSNLIETQCLEYTTTLDFSNHDFHLTNGPILTVFVNENLDMYFLPYKMKRSLNLQSVFPAKDIKILQFSCINQIYNDNVFDVILLIVSGEVRNEQELSIFFICVNPESECIPEICEKLPLTIFFPEFLKNHAKAIEVSNLLIAEQIMSQINDIDWTDNQAIVCTKSDCFVCIKGEIKYFINITLQDTILIKNEFSLFSSFFYVILLSKQENLSLLQPIENTNKLQVKKLYTDIQCVFTGDILLNGSRSMILIKNTNLEEWQDCYSITDISSFLPVDILEQPVIPDDCLQATLSGLDAKFQTGKSAIAKRESEIREKTEATIHAIHHLQDIDDRCIESCDESSFQDSLVDIILSKDENNKREMKIRKDKSKLKFLNHWVKLINNKWVLCFTYLNEDERSICSPVLKIMAKDQVLQCYQKVFLNSSFKFSLEDKCFKEIKPQQKFSILSAFDPPAFFTKNVPVRIILSWFKGTLNEFENELFLSLEEKSLVQHQLCFQIDLKITDIFNSKNQDISAVEDLYCMKVFQKEALFKITSLCSKLIDLEDKFFSSEFCVEQLCSFSNTTNSRTFCFKNPISCLYGAHFSLIYFDDIATEMKVFISNDKQLLTVIQFLRECLPKDIAFIPCCQTAEDMVKMKQKMICSMKEETDLLISTLNAHNICSQIKDLSYLPVQAGTIIIPKKTFKRIRKALIKKEYNTDNILSSFSEIDF